VTNQSEIFIFANGHMNIFAICKKKPTDYIPGAIYPYVPASLLQLDGSGLSILAIPKSET